MTIAIYYTFIDIFRNNYVKYQTRNYDFKLKTQKMKTNFNENINLYNCNTSDRNNTALLMCGI